MTSARDHANNMPRQPKGRSDGGRFKSKGGPRASAASAVNVDLSPVETVDESTNANNEFSGSALDKIYPALGSTRSTNLRGMNIQEHRPAESPDYLRCGEIVSFELEKIFNDFHTEKLDARPSVDNSELSLVDRCLQGSYGDGMWEAFSKDVKDVVSNVSDGTKGVSRKGAINQEVSQCAEKRLIEANKNFVHQLMESFPSYYIINSDPRTTRNLVNTFLGSNAEEYGETISVLFVPTLDEVVANRGDATMMKFRTAHIKRPEKGINEARIFRLRAKQYLVGVPSAAEVVERWYKEKNEL